MIAKRGRKKLCIDEQICRHGGRPRECDRCWQKLHHRVTRTISYYLCAHCRGDLHFSMYDWSGRTSTTLTPNPAPVAINRPNTVRMPVPVEAPNPTIQKGTDFYCSTHHKESSVRCEQCYQYMVRKVSSCVRCGRGTRWKDHSGYRICPPHMIEWQTLKSQWIPVEELRKGGGEVVPDAGSVADEIKRMCGLEGNGQK